MAKSKTPSVRDINKKYCNKCSQSLDVERFYKNSAGGLRTPCKSCSNNSGKAWKNKNYDTYLPKLRLREQLQTKSKRVFVDTIKTSMGCIDCGYNENPIALEFDHVKDIKTKGISAMIASHANTEAILEEIAKFEVRCACCHRIKTKKDLDFRKNEKTPTKKLENHRRSSKKRIDFINLFKNAPCTRCGIFFPPEAMDFDHKDPNNKKGDVSRLSINLISFEIAKCDLLCACCHRIKTSEDRLLGIIKYYRTERSGKIPEIKI